MTTERIEALEAKGFKRWQKAGYDRLYVNASTLGLVCTFYNTGNICSAYFNDERVSNCEARRMRAAKTFIDVATERVHSDNRTLENAVKGILETI